MILTSEEIERKVAFLRFSQGCEGFIMTSEDEKNVRDILSNHRTDDEIVTEITETKTYSPKTSVKTLT